MTVTSDTRISTIIRDHPAAIDAIASLNRNFRKLKNPFLRKVLAKRVTVAQAAWIGGVTVDEFLANLANNGIEVEHSAGDEEERRGGEWHQDKPAFMAYLGDCELVKLDVRDDLTNGEDPFQKIIHALNGLGSHEVLLLINSFVPAPLIGIASRKGFTYYVDEKGDDLVYTYFKPTEEQGELSVEDDHEERKRVGDLEQKKGAFSERLKEIDVRDLEMPQPMLTILNTLEELPEDWGLYVYHKRVPVYLLPELENRGFTYEYEERDEGDVRMLIWKSNKVETDSNN